jgi:hypothetical protein
MWRVYGDDRGAELSPTVYGLYRFKNNIQVLFFAQYVDDPVSVKESFVAGSPSIKDIATSLSLR